MLRSFTRNARNFLRSSLHNQKANRILFSKLLVFLTNDSARANCKLLSKPKLSLPFGPYNSNNMVLAAVCIYLGSFVKLPPVCCLTPALQSYILVKMNRAFVCDLYQYEVKKGLLYTHIHFQLQLGKGGGIVAKLHYAWSHLAPATFLLFVFSDYSMESLHQRLVS